MHKKKKWLHRVIAFSLILAILISIPVHAAGGLTAALEDIMKGLSTFVYKVYEWPNSLTIGSSAFSIAESIYTIRQGGNKKPVLWDDDTIEEQMKNFYSSTDWTQFSGMYETIELSSACEAELTAEVEPYEMLMDIAADTQGFSVYKELFKAIAQARFNEYKDEYEYALTKGYIEKTGDDRFDLFHIDGSWIDGGKTPLEENKAPASTPMPTSYVLPSGAPTPTPSPMPEGGPSDFEIKAESLYTVQQSIDMAAQVFKRLLYEAAFPSPYYTDPLICIVQGFEFGGDSSSIQSQFTSSGMGLSGYPGFVTFTEYCKSKEATAGSDPEYDSYIEDYARVVSHNVLRNNEDWDNYGKYKYSDQMFYRKVFEVYNCTGGGGVIDLSNLPEDYREIMQKCMRTWGSEVTKERRAIIQNAVLLYGVHYDMDQRNTPSIDNPELLDCSSFVGQAYWRAGLYDKDTATWCTGTFASNFIKIDESEIIPGDIAQKIWNPGGSGPHEHIGIYVGEVDGTKYFIHCTRDDYGHNGVVVNDYYGFDPSRNSNAAFGRSPKL